MPSADECRTAPRCDAQCRYVTRPRFLPLLPKPIVAPRVSYHFRTSLADVPDTLVAGPPPHRVGASAAVGRPSAPSDECTSDAVTRAAEPSRWTRSVCGTASGFDSRGYVMSDAPGLVALLQARAHRGGEAVGAVVTRGRGAVGEGGGGTRVC